MSVSGCPRDGKPAFSRKACGDPEDCQLESVLDSRLLRANEDLIAKAKESLCTFWSAPSGCFIREYDRSGPPASLFSNVDVSRCSAALHEGELVGFKPGVGEYSCVEFRPS